MHSTIVEKSIVSVVALEELIVYFVRTLLTALF